MNRRHLLGVLGLVSTTGVVAAGREPVAARMVSVEPGPTRFDFEPICSIGADVSVHTVSMALGVLNWDTDDPVKPLLCVHPASYAWALPVVQGFDYRIALRAAAFCPDIDTWFVAWHGRRAGSVGA